MKFQNQDQKISRLTTREFWLSYWSERQAEAVHKEVFFQNFLSYFPPAPKRFIEIGGFPGTHSIYFKKFFNYDVTLLDFIIDPKVISESATLSGVDPQSIHLMEGDLFSLDLQPEPVFDVVFSAGFIEHFQNPEAVFQKHVEYLAPQGLLFVSVPNFWGISGWVQKFFDPDNYKAHSLACMKISYLHQCAQVHNLEILFLDHAGIPHVWLDHPEKVSLWGRFFIRFLSAGLQRMKFLKGRLFSPYVILIARRSSELFKRA